MPAMPAYRMMERYIELKNSLSALYAYHQCNYYMRRPLFLWDFDRPILAAARNVIVISRLNARYCDAGRRAASRLDTKAREGYFMARTFNTILRSSAAFPHDDIWFPPARYFSENQRFRHISASKPFIKMRLYAMLKDFTPRFLSRCFDMREREASWASMMRIFERKTPCLEEAHFRNFGRRRDEIRQQYFQLQYICHRCICQGCRDYVKLCAGVDMTLRFVWFADFARILPVAW